MRRWHVRALWSVLACAALLAAPAARVRAQQSTSGPRPSPGLARGMQVSTEAATVIPGVPAYVWHHGCGPTAVGMVVGYWDGHGFPDLVPGDASTPTAAVLAMIADDGGDPACGGSGNHFLDYACPIDESVALADRSQSGGAHASNCVADFMRASWSSAGNRYGWSWNADVVPAFVGYVRYAAPQYTAFGANYPFASFSWEMYKAEIDAGRPMVVLVDADGDGASDHFSPAIGYSEDGGPRYAVFDTWDTRVHWYAWRPVAVGSSWGVYSVTTFGLLQNVASLNTAADESALALGGDGLRAIEEAARAGEPSRLYEGRRAARDSAFGAFVRACGLPPAGGEGGPWLSADARRLYFGAVDPGQGAEWDLFEASRPDPDSCFAAPAALAELNAAPCGSSDPSLTADEREIFFARTCPGGDADLWHAVRADPAAPFGAPEPLAGVNSGANDADPGVSADGLRLYFSSDRAGGIGGYDLWLATRASRGDVFGAPVDLSILNSPLAERHPRPSSDGAELYFSSDRAGGAGGYDLWRLMYDGSAPQSAAGGPVSVGAASLAARARPNPFRGSTTIEAALPVFGHVVADVLDAAGRRVRRIECDGAGAVVRLTWDGRTDAGAAAPAGAYFVRLESGGRLAAGRVVLVR